MPNSLHATNNFNLLRLFFALMVVAYHVAILSNVPAFAAFIAPLSVCATVGVQGFFVLSGYLVYASFDRSGSIALYAEKRIRRLYPAYAVVVLACAIAALALSPEARSDLVGVGRYVGWNLIFANFMEPNLPGVFVGNSTPEVNGALWTLKIEVMFYLILPLLAGLLRGMGRFAWIACALIYGGAEVWRIGLTGAGEFELARQLPGQLSFFITGVLLYGLRLGGWRLHAAGVVGAILFAASLVWVVAEPLRAVGLGMLAIWVAVGLPRLPDAARFGDVSYGVYIVHFPIIQAFVALGVFSTNAWLGGGGAIMTSLVGALLLWRLVERPALRLDSAYRRTNP